MSVSSRIILALALGAVVACTPSVPVTVTASPVANPEISAILTERIATGRSTGLVAGILEPTAATRVVAAGPGAGGAPLNGHSVVEIGSITKGFTGLLLADMVVRGEVALDDPVAKFLPADVRVPSRGGREITLLDLATHTSGLPRLPANMAPADPTNPYADYTAERLYSFLSSHALTRDIGAQYEYSNLGAGLLGHALSLRAGKPLETLFIERILEPLGMRDTRITLSDDMAARMAPGHDAGGSRVRLWDLGALAGAGALRSTMNDMLIFLAAMRDTTSGPLARAAALAQRPQRSAGGNMRIGLGWHVLEAMGSTIVWHNGGTAGFHTFAGFDRQTGAGAVVFSTKSQSIDDLAMHLINPRFPLAPAPVQRSRIAVAPEILDRYVGVYELAPNFSITITREGDGLGAQATGQPKFPIYAESETRFFLEVVDAQLTFQRDASGMVTGLVLHQGGRDTPGRRVR